MRRRPQADTAAVTSVDVYFACSYCDLVTTIQIRNVPDTAHRALKARAALEGRSLSEFALSELLRSLERPTRRELLARLQGRARVDVPDGAAAWVRTERDSR